MIKLVIKASLFISKEQILRLYSCFYYLSQKSKSHTLWMIKPITKIRVTYLPKLISFTTKQNSKNPTQKRAKISTTRP